MAQSQFSRQSDSIWCFIFLLIVSGGEQFLVYKVGLITGTFYQVLGEKNKDGFFKHVIYSLSILLAVTLVKSLKDFTARIIGVIWRKHLTNYVQALYFTSLRFYTLTSIGKVFTLIVVISTYSKIFYFMTNLFFRQQQN